jgi:cysteine desulfurase
MLPIYLDNAASTPCDPRVLEIMRPFFFEKSGNASSPHKQGRQARRAIEEARETLATFIGAVSTEIVFTSGASESNNQAIFSVARALKNKGRHLIASAVEHHSVLEPLHQLERDGFEVTFIKPKADGIVAVEDIKSAVRPDTILVCLIHANNEIGTIQPIEETGAFCRERGIYFLVDATQTIGHLPVNVKKINCDFLSLSAHKFYGPQGIGALYIRQSTECPSLIFGGDQERGRRAGTQNTTGIIGLGEAVNLCSKEMTQAAPRETILRDKIIDDVLKEIPSVSLNGHRTQRLPNNAHFSFSNINSEELISALDQAGICVSMGSACTWGRLESSHVLKAVGLSDQMALGSLRVTVGRWTTEQDINYFLEQLKSKVNQLRAS